MSKGLEALKRVQCNYVHVFKARENGKTQLVHDLNTIKKELEALNEILPLYGKWLGNEISDFEFFTLLNNILDKYDLLKEALL